MIIDAQNEKKQIDNDSTNANKKENENAFNPFKKCKTESLLASIYWIFSFPIGVIFYFTIPGYLILKIKKFFFKDSMERNF